MKSLKLQKQLRKEGAGEFEAGELAVLADKLGDLKFKGLSKDARDEIGRIPDGKRHFYLPTRWAMAGSMAIVVVLVLGLAQTAKPGSALYALKVGTEDARATVQPGYTKTLVEKRKEEVQQLQKEEAPAADVKKAEDNLKKAQKKAEQQNQHSNGSSQSRSQQNGRFRNWNNWRRSQDSSQQNSGSSNNSSGTSTQNNSSDSTTQPQTSTGSTSSGTGSSSTGTH